MWQVIRLPSDCSYQDAEKARQRRSRVAQGLNVSQGYAFASSLAAALLDGLFEHPEVILAPAPYGIFWPGFPYQTSFLAAY